MGGKKIRTGAVVLLVPAALFAWKTSAAAADKAAGERSAAVSKTAGEKEKQGQYLRLTKDENGKPLALEAAIVRFITPQAGASGNAGAVVDLIGAVHVAEPEYYDSLNNEFENYDTVLYEMVAPKDAPVPKGGENENRHPVAAIQTMMTKMLELEYQLDGIDYDAENFVHADMSPDEFQKSMNDRGESFLGMFLRAVGYSMTQSAPSGSGTSDAQLLMAMFDKNRALALKRIMARQFQDMGGALAIFNGPNGSTLITERNKVALDSLKKQLAAGDKKIAVFYGAGHLPDMAERLEKDFGMKRQETRWLKAWNLGDNEE